MIADNKLKCIEMYEAGLALYRQKKFDEAISSFKGALDVCPDDGPSMVFLKRCEYFKLNPVADDWDGVFDMKTK